MQSIALVSVGTMLRSKEGETTQNPPMGLLYVGGALKKAGYDVHLYHITSKEIEKTIEKIESLNPLFVGFSTFTGAQLTHSSKMSKILKERLSCPMVWGGVHPSLLPEETLSEDYVDIVVIGEGEITAVELADALSNGSKLNDVAGIGLKSKSGKQFLTEDRPHLKNLDDYRIDWDLVNIKKYFYPFEDSKRAVNFITSRGCPHSCGFCYNFKFNKSHWRAHSKEFVVKELVALKDSYSVDGVVFSDDNLFVDKRRAIDMLREINLPWHGDLRIDYVTEKLAEEIESVNCKEAFFGIESGSERILKLINKGITVPQVMRAAEIFAKHPDIIFDGSTIVGMPTETRKEVDMTLDLVLKLSDIHPRIRVNIGLYLPFPGTPMFELARKNGFVPPKKTEDWAMFDVFGGEVKPVWLPWADESFQDDMANAYQYSQFLERAWFQKQGLYGIPRRLLYQITRLRFQKKFFKIPLELNAYLALKNSGIVMKTKNILKSGK